MGYWMKTLELEKLADIEKASGGYGAGQMMSRFSLL
jgi:hypothetical protein